MSKGGFECQFYAFYIFLIFSFPFLEVLSGKYPEFFTSGICLVLFIQNLSGILSCSEYVQLNCPEFFHVWNITGFIYPEFAQNSFMSGICPAFSAYKNSEQQI
jgi:hypothetical protein